MSLRPTLDHLSTLLTQQPNAENQAKLKPSIKKFLLAAKELIAHLELAAVENSKEYATLSGLLSDPAKRSVVTLDWANAILKKLKKSKIVGKSLTTVGKKHFLLTLAASPLAPEIIAELSETEEEKLQKAFAQLAKLSSKKAEKEIAENYKKDKFEKFCQANAINLIKGKTGVDRKATVELILVALGEFKDRQKL